jgi:U32 family peptidase
MNTLAKPHPELLAPAGDWDSLRAAVANGADAVYFGLSKYSARQRAANFTLEALPETLAYLHRHNVRGYVAFNTLIFSDELPEAAALAAAVARAGADAVIVQDLGLARLIHRLAPTLPLHASTQMTLTEPHGIERVRRLGVERVILARELSLDQIRRIRDGTAMPLEVFIHGALCMSYSGQCLASEALWGRSANRGLCGQACRLPYRLLVGGRQRELGGRQYLLSTQDLAAYDRVANLVALGVTGFKIEGRLKSPHYVAAATQVYRAALDAAVAGRRFEVAPDGRLRLVQSFSRGFTHGFLDGADHASLVHGLHPRSRGVRVGTVAGSTPRGVLVALEAGAGTLAPGDGIVFDEGRLPGEEQAGRLFAVERGRERGTTVLIFSPADVNPEDVTLGCEVRKTDDPRLEREMERSYARDAVVRRVPLALRLEARAGRPLVVRATDDAGNTADAASEAPLEAALRRPLTEELVREQFGRLGETPFELATLEIVGEAGPTLSAPVMAPKSVLNDLRRKVVEALLAARAKQAGHALAEPEALAALRAEIRVQRVPLPVRAVPLEQNAGGQAASGTPELAVLCRTLEQLDAVLAWPPPAGLPRPTMVYCDFADGRGLADAVARCRAAGTAVGLATLRILKPGDEPFLRAIADAAPDAVLVRNLAGLEFMREQAPALPLIGDFSLNAVNELAAEELAASCLARLAPGLDLNLRQLLALAARWTPARLEPIIHLHMPMMYTEHCPAAAHLSQGAAGGACRRPCDAARLALKDRVSAVHPLVFDARCGCTIFSGHVQSAVESLAEMRGAGLRHFRVELLDETPAAVHALLDLYSRVLAGQTPPEDAALQLADLSPGGLRRGTWDFE